jgi:hypothetical protein
MEKIEIESISNRCDAYRKKNNLYRIDILDDRNGFEKST